MARPLRRSLYWLGVKYQAFSDCVFLDAEPASFFLDFNRSVPQLHATWMLEATAGACAAAGICRLPGEGNLGMCEWRASEEVLYRCGTISGGFKAQATALAGSTRELTGSDLESGNQWAGLGQTRASVLVGPGLG